MRIILVPGLWLDASAWDEVVPALADLGHRAEALTLPGQGAEPVAASLDDQVSAVVAAVDDGEGPVLVVGHSAAGALAWAVADARPEQVAGVATIGGFPQPDGSAYADFFEPQDGLVPFPGWAAFEGPDSADLDEDARSRFSAAAIPVPAAVTRGVVRLCDDRRYAVPLTLVCPEFSPAEAQGWMASGDLPELARVAERGRLDLVDLDSGHWPMLTRPHELARVLSDVATGLG